jgi:plastocyanin
MIKRSLMILVVLCAGIIPASAAVWTVNVADFQFTPSQLTILQGDTVIWINTLGFHNVHHKCDPSLFGNDAASSPWTYQFIFNVATGLYPYECEIHPDMMQGSITVNRRGRWNVTVQSFSFRPANLTIMHGDTVTWNAIGGFHNVHHNATPSLFGLPAASAPWTYSFIFNGGDSTYHYVCQVHPSTMQGSVSVLAPIVPAAPLGLTAQPSADLSTVNLNWSGVCGTRGYNIYRSSDVSPVSFPVFLGSTSDTVWMDTIAPESSARYFYQVISNN